MCSSDLTISAGNLGQLIQAHVHPMPRLEVAACLVEAGIQCALDVSDGLRGDAAHICEQSGLSAEIVVDRILVHSALEEQFDREEALRLALDGGEDYELLCAGPETTMLHAIALAEERTGVPLTIIGRLTASSPSASLVRLIDSEGNSIDAPSASWDHFRHA